MSAPEIAQPWLAHYEEGVPHTVEIPPVLVPSLLADAAARYPNKLALRLVLKYGPLGLRIGSTITYQALAAASNRFAAALQGLGLRPGDRVAIMLPNLPQQVIAYFGILKMGAIVVNVNPTYPAPELRHTLADSGAKAIVLLSGLVEKLTPIRHETAIEHVIVTDLGETVSWPIRMLVEKQARATGMMTDIAPGAGVVHWGAMLAAATAKPAPMPAGSAQSPTDTVLFQYTGGTTGVPKAAMLSHRNLVANVLQMAAWFRRIEPGKEKWLLVLPVFHVYGMSAGLLLGLYFGAEVVIVADPRNTAHVLQVVEREQITMYVGVPAMYIALINHPNTPTTNLRSLKACFSGGSALPAEVALQFEATTGARLVEGFGMTESSPLALGNPIYGQARPGSIGLPFPSTLAAICALNPSADGAYALLPAGSEGELVLKGPQVMSGYWQMPDETAKTIDKEGWLHTGDIARMDADGYFTIVDRKKDIIIASGFNIVPREVEEVLFQFPKVLDATVAGVPDPKRGETVKAYVVLKPGQSATADEIRAFCKERLAPYKVPSLVEFRAELPKTQAGKVLRRQLVAEEKAKLGIAS